MRKVWALRVGTGRPGRSGVQTPVSVINSSEELLGHFEASEACSEGSQQPCLYQEVVHYQTDVETSEPSPRLEERERPQSMIVVNNVINQQIIIIEEQQPVLLFKT